MIQKKTSQINRFGSFSARREQGPPGPGLLPVQVSNQGPVRTPKTRRRILRQLWKQRAFFGSNPWLGGVRAIQVSKSKPGVPQIAVGGGSWDAGHPPNTNLVCYVRGNVTEKMETPVPMLTISSNSSKAYRALIRTATGNVHLICVTYHPDSSKKFSCADIYELVLAIPEERILIPDHRQATFREELRALGRASATFGGDRSHEEEFLRSKLVEAYGPVEDIQLEEIS